MVSGKNRTMLAVQIAVFALVLFLALAALFAWKRYRDRVRIERMNRGLRGFVAESTVEPHALEDTHAETPEETGRERLTIEDIG
jgi:hypothetical protein